MELGISGEEQEVEGVGGYAVREVRQDIEGHNKELGLHSDLMRCQLVFSSEMQ